MTLQWKSSMNGQEIRIFRGKLIAGLLKRSFWKDNAYGELNGHMVRFKTKGFWKPTTQILDIEGKQELGQIVFNTWKSTAAIRYQDQTYHWEFDSWTRKKWTLRTGEDFVQYVKTSSWKNEGDIEIEEISPALILTGLFVYGYFWKIAAS
jgi:hypothetical protein